MKTFNSHLNKKLKNKSFADKFKAEQELLSLALKICEERNNLGLSQTQLATKAKVTQQQLSRIETGQNCNILTLVKVSRALNLSIQII